MQQDTGFETDDVTLVTMDLGSIPLSAALSAARAMGRPPSIEVAATIAVRILCGAAAGEFSARDVLVSSSGAVRVRTASIGSPATDVHASAKVLWEMLAGRSFPSGKAEPPSLFRSGIPLKLESAVLRALAADPNARFVSAGAFARAIESAVSLATPAAVGGWVETMSRRPAKPPSTIRQATPYVAASIALCIGFGTAWAFAPRSTHVAVARPLSLDDQVRASVSLVGRAEPASQSTTPVNPLPEIVAPVRHEPAARHEPAHAVALASQPAPPATTAAAEPAPIARATCANPFRIDERGIRRVRRECL